MAENVFGKTITDLRRYAVKEPLSVRKANAEVDAINALSHAIGNPEQIIRPRPRGNGEPSDLAIRYATIEGVIDPTSRAVLVQFKKWNDDDPPVLENDGPPTFVECWPDLLAGDYVPFELEPDLFMVLKMQGGWVVYWKVRFTLVEPDPALPWGTCLR